MKITVKNLKVAAFASEETLCFNATVYVDGKPAFAAANQGHGGCNNYWPLKGGNNSMEKAVMKWAEAQPKIVTDMKMGGAPFEYQPGIDHYVDAAITRYQYEQDAKKALKKVTVIQGGVLFTYKAPAAKLEQIRDHITKEDANSIFLNDLPFDQAVDMFVQHA